jgi:hypothetical protein
MRSFLWALPVATGALLLAGSVAIAQPDREPASVDHACAVTMGLTPATTDYKACIDRLSETVAKLQDRQAMEQKRAACAAGGLADGTPAFASCMAQKQGASVEARACAEQGLAPGDAGYASCVATLKSAIAYDHYQYSAGE